MKKISLYFQLFSLITFGSLVMASCSSNHIIQTQDRNIVSVSVKEGTIPNEVFVGHFDEAGIKLVVNYSDDTTEEVDLTSSMIPESYRRYLSIPGEYEIKIYYRNVETTVTVKIVDAHYTVNFYAYIASNSYSLVNTQDVLENGNATAPNINNNVYYLGKHYSFKEWNKSFSNITRSVDVYANYDVTNFYVVNFYNAKQELISSQKVDEGEDAVEPTESERNMSGYEFIGWDRSYLNVTKSVDVYGLYVSVSLDYINNIPVEDGKVTFYFEMADDENAVSIPSYCSVYLTGAFLAKNGNWPTKADEVITLQPLEEGSNIWYGQWEGDYRTLEDMGYELTLGYSATSGSPSTGINWYYKSIECIEAAGDSGLDIPLFTLSNDGKLASLGTHHWEEVPVPVIIVEDVTLSITLAEAAPEWVTLFAPGNYRNNWLCNAEDAMTPSNDRKTWTIHIDSVILGAYEMKIIAEYSDSVIGSSNYWTWGNTILDNGEGGNFSLYILRANGHGLIDLNERAEGREIHADFDFETNLPDPTKISQGNFKIVLGAALDTTVNPKWYVIGSFTGWRAVELNLNGAKTELTASFPKLIWDSEAQFGICSDDGWHIAIKEYDNAKDQFGLFSYVVPHVEHNIVIEVTASEVIKMNTAIDPDTWVEIQGSISVSTNG